MGEKAAQWVAFFVLVVFGLWAVDNLFGKGGGGNGKKLYTYYKSFNGNQDSPGNFEEEFVDGKILSTCDVGGKYKGYFGFIVTKQIFFGGRPVNPPTVSDPLYLYVIDKNDTISGAWRGKEQMQGLLDSWAGLGCSPPKMEK